MKARARSASAERSTAATAEHRQPLLPSQIAGAVRAPMPAFVEPCLATLVDKPPEGDAWVHEIKFDGYRIEARLGPKDVRLLTRNGLDWTARFGDLPQLLRTLHSGTAIIDCELVVEDTGGHSSFTALAETLKGRSQKKFILQCFDLLYLDGINVMGAPLTERKALLRRLLEAAPKGGQIRYSEHLAGQGAKILSEACKLGLEGIISKRADRPYRSGRNGDWLKSKCIETDEFVIVGFVPSNVSKNAVGALVVGYYQRGQLLYAGRVGTGFSNKVASELYKLLKPLWTAEAPVAARLTGLQRKGVVWVRPELVAQIEYRAWTADNLLRHAAFKGLREDKPARDVRKPKVKSVKP